jgi:hypothetical protein
VARLVAEHRKLIVGLQHNGRDTTEAMKLLATREDIQAMHVRHRDWLLAELMDDSES